MEKFIYVFDTASRDELVGAGFLLLKSDERNSIYVFGADDRMSFALADGHIPYVGSDVLTF